MHLRFLILFVVVLLVSCKIRHSESVKFPDSWVRLTKLNGEWVIFNSCDAGNRRISLKGSNELLLFGEQDDAEFVIDHRIEQGDTISFETHWKGGEEKMLFRFIWIDRQQGLGRWLTISPNDNNSDYVFVDGMHEAGYKVVNQPCRECWGDECED